MSDTSCQKCCFALYQDITQTDCQLHLLDKFRKQGDNIIEAYNEEGEFYVIENRICPYFRTQDWFDRHQYPVQQIYKEVQLKYSCIIYLNKNSTLDELEITLESLSKQVTLPQEIIFISENNIKFKEVEELTKELNVKWYLNKLINNESTLIDLAKDRIITGKFIWYFIFTAGYEIPNDFIGKFAFLILRDLKFFLMSIPEEEGGLVINKVLYSLEKPLKEYEKWILNTEEILNERTS